MNLDQIKDIVHEHFSQNNVLISTERIENRLSQALKKLMDSGDMEATKEAIFEKLDYEKTVDFLKERQPNISPVEPNVIEAVKKYFKDSSLSYFKPISISRASNHPEDSFLYFVVGINERDNTYACWTSWNQSLQSLNYGHYILSNMEEVNEILNERFNDITDEPEKYGPSCTRVIIDTADSIKKDNQKECVVPITMKKGR